VYGEALNAGCAEVHVVLRMDAVNLCKIEEYASGSCIMCGYGEWERRSRGLGRWWG
jgi:hypothetical protein